MTITQLEESIRYMTDASGKKTDVMVPMEIWEKIMAVVQAKSGLNPIDELEPDYQILEDIQTSIREVKAGQFSPVSEIWNEIEE